MKIILKIFLLHLVLSVNAAGSGYLIDEVIRRKVENLPVFQGIDKNYSVYCIRSLREAYLENDFEPFWKEQAQIDSLISLLKLCHTEGLNPSDYHVDDFNDFNNTNDPEAEASLDILLSDAFLLYTTHMLAGKVNPETIDPEWHVVKTDKNPLRFLYQLDTVPVNRIKQQITPNNKYYPGLVRQLAYYKEINSADKIQKIGKGPAIKPGTRDNRIPSIRVRLNIVIQDSSLNEDDNENYDDSLKLAVIHFQKQHGLEALGNIGDQTIEALNTGSEERIKTIRVNLERLRWLPQELPNYYLMVNIVNFELDVVENNSIVRKHKVIVGKPFRKTPVFSSTMQYLVLNPTWTVPPTILKNDLIPEVRKNKDYLAQKNIHVYDATGKRLHTDSIDWKSNKIYGYTYRQEPGKNNALGAVKFMFPNKFNVYLHDTPSREHFDKTERAFSSGCIRVHKPLELAAFLLRDQKQYSLAEIQKIVDSSKTQTIMLRQRPDVFLLYLTSWVNEEGTIQFRKDIYERDERVFQALNEDPEIN